MSAMTVVHRAACPFPAQLPSGKTVVDELCRCGHKRSEHGDNGPAYGHAACGTCGCDRFTWMEYLIAPKNARALRPRKVRP